MAVKNRPILLIKDFFLYKCNQYLDTSKFFSKYVCNLIIQRKNHGTHVPLPPESKMVAKTAAGNVIYISMYKHDKVDIYVKCVWY